MAEGSQGPRSYMFSAQRVRVTRKGKPGEGAWAVYRWNLDGSEPRYYAPWSMFGVGHLRRMAADGRVAAFTGRGNVLMHYFPTLIG